MLIGAGTSAKLQVETSAAGSLMFAASVFLTDQSNPPVLQGSSGTGPVLLATITGAAGTYDLIVGTASRSTRVDEFSLYNNSSTVVNTLKFKRTDATNTPVEFLVTLLPGETVTYVNGVWTHYDSNMGVYAAGSQIQAQGVMVHPLFATANLTSTKTITSASCFALYMGRLTKPISSAQIRYQVTTAMATITWGELALAKGSVNPGGNPTLTVVGYADISAVANSTGRKTTTVNVSAGQSLNAGDDLWVIIGNQATTAGIVRAQSIADDNQAGMQASVASRPSTILGTPTAFTIEGATTLAAWLTAFV